MNYEDAAELAELNGKLKLGRMWLDKIGYRPEWSNEEFISAVNLENMTAEAKAAIVFALKHCGEQAIAEGDALVAEGEMLEAKFELGSKWLAHIGYNPEWTNEQFRAAVAREEASPEALEAIQFALRRKGQEMISEADVLDELYAAVTGTDHTAT